MSKFIRTDPADVINKYFDEMRKIPVLTADQESVATRQIEQTEIDLLLCLMQPIAFKTQVMESLDTFIKTCDLRHIKPNDKIEVDRLMGIVKSDPNTDGGVPFICLVRHIDPERKWVGELVNNAQNVGQRSKNKSDISQDVWKKKLIYLKDQVRREKAHFITTNLRIVVKLAKQFHRDSHSVGINDLIQEGNSGLSRAIDRHDPRRGWKFSTYAVWWIKHFIRRGIDEKDSLVRVPVHIIDSHRKISAAEAKHYALTGENLRVTKPSIMIGSKAKDIDYVELSRPKRNSSFDAPLVDGENSTLFDVIADEKSPDAHEEMIDKLRKGAIQKLLKKLTPVEARVIVERFGLQGKDPRTLADIARDYSLSRERIRQIEAVAFQKLKRQTAAQELR